MLRVYVGAWLITLFMGAAPPWAVAAEKKAAAKTSNSASTRGDVIAALRAEAAGDNDRRSELLYKAWLDEKDLPEANWHTGRVRSDENWLTLGEAVSHAVNDPDAAGSQELRQRAKDIRACGAPGPLVPQTRHGGPCPAALGTAIVQSGR